MSFFWNRNRGDARHLYNPPIVLSSNVSFGLGIVLMMVAIVYEVLFVMVMRKGGIGPVDRVGQWMWTLPPVAIATALSVTFSSLHFTTQRMQPLADLAAGNSPPNKSLHLDYLSMVLPLACWKSFTNRHHTVTCTALMAMLSLSLSSLSSTVIVVKTALKPIAMPLVQMTEFGISNTTKDLTDFQASAAVTYAYFEGVGRFPKFTTPFFALPKFNKTDTPYGNASATVPITFPCQAIRSMANCAMATVALTSRLNNSATAFVASGGGLPDGCTYNFTATPQLTYHTDLVTCSNFPNATHAPVAFWLGIDFPEGSTTASVHPINSTAAPINASVVICSPTLSVATVSVTVNADDMIDGNNIQEYGQDLTFQPTGGLALNGMSYPLEQLDVRTKQRLKNIQFQFTDVIYSAVIKGLFAQELKGHDIQDQMNYTASHLYQTYLSILASLVFFVPTQNGKTIVGISDVPLLYLFVSTPSVHILTGLLASLSISSLFVAYHLRHKHNRDGLAQKLGAITGSPFTLAGAMNMFARQSWANGFEAIAPSGGTNGPLSGNQKKTTLYRVASEDDMVQRLAQHTYTLDRSGKVVQHP